MDLSQGSILKVGKGLEISKAVSVASPIAAIIVSILIVILVVWPKFSQVLRLRTANEQLASRAQALDEKAQRLSTQDREILEKQLAAAEALLPSDKGTFLIIRQVESAAQASGVILSRLDVTPGAIGAEDDKQTGSSAAPASGEGDETAVDTPKLPVRISVGSDYKSLLLFLGNLLSSARVNSIRDLTLSVVTAESGQMKATMTVEAYWQSLPKELPSIESPLPQLADSEIAKLEQISATGLSSAAPSASSVPSVPIGKTDLFTPF